MRPLIKHIVALVIAGMVLACVNEPFTLMPLGVTLVENLTTATTAQYKYKDRRIQTFMKWRGGDTTKWTFHYSDRGLERIVIDSTADDYRLIRVTGGSPKPARDSLFHVGPWGQILIQTRVFSYNPAEQLTQVEELTPVPTGTIRALYTLEWTGGNITTLTRETTESTGSVTATTLSIGHDGRSGIYSSELDYMYTISLDELYWLSASNPVRFKRDSLKQVSYKYFYNTRGYPTHIITDHKQVIGHTYIELR